jgi:hypothetical protein
MRRSRVVWQKLGVLPHALGGLIFCGHFPLGEEPMLNIAPLGTSAPHPDFVCPFANKATFFQRSRRHLEFIGKLLERLQRSPVIESSI